MDRQEQAIATMEALVFAQEQAKARIWGTIERVREHGGATATTNMKQNPELTAIAPHAMETFTVGGFSITRRKVDQIDNFYIKRL